MSVEINGTPNLTVPFGKQADTVPEVHEIIRSRWSPRAFSSRSVQDGDLRTILEAGRWAASSFNEQPWRFLVARKSDGPAYERLLSLLVPANQAWAKDAPVLLFTAAKRTFSHDGSPNYHGLHDAGQALAHIALQATALGLHTHSMGGFDHERARKELAIPDDFEVGAAVALGYWAEPHDSSKSQPKKRQRKPLDELVFGSKWNEQLKL